MTCIYIAAIIRYQKFCLACRESPGSSRAFKNQRKLLTSGVIFGLNRYKCFAENKNIITTFYDFKRILSLVKILLVLINKT